jgi:hypothetical protein
MADGFQPKFVDLVRNYTTNVGTDDFVLGPAVNGFASFTDACAVGDQFYYSAIGIDNPGETEVGRGTLLAGGVIRREPFSGTRTHFKSGTKAVALVAAAEWFAEVDAVRSSGAGMLNVKAFGAAGDSDADRSSGTDDTAAIQAALDAIGARGGGTLFVPDGHYKVSSYLTLPKSVKISMSAGAVIVATHAGGGGASAGENLRNGSVFYSNWPSNGSTPAHIVIEGGMVRCANGANEGAAFYDNCGTFIRLRGVRAYAFKYGFVFDQSELVDVVECDISSAASGGACIWIVNGSSLTAGNQGTFSNRISVKRSQINAAPSVYGILDDGGTTHAFSDNNYNGCLNHIRAAGVLGLTVEGGEFESAAGAPIWLDFLALDGHGVGSCSQAHFDAPVIVPSGTNPCIHIQAAGNLIFSAPFLGNTTSPKIVGTGNAYALYSVGAVNAGGGATFDGKATHHWEVGNTGGAVVQNSNIALAVPTLDVAGEVTAANIGSAAAREESDFLLAVNDLSDIGSGIGAARNLRTAHVLAQSASPVSHTGDTAEVILASVVVPANSMGPNGRLNIEADFSINSSSTAKTLAAKFGGVTLLSVSPNQAVFDLFEARVTNRSAADAQRWAAKRINGSTNATTAAGTSAVDTTQDVTVEITGQLASAADTVTLESFQVILYPGDAA